MVYKKSIRLALATMLVATVMAKQTMAKQTMTMTKLAQHTYLLTSVSEVGRISWQC